MNDVLEPRRIILRDIVEDMYDGQILSELIGKEGKTVESYNNNNVSYKLYT